jgi:hypothetical protein
MPPDYTGMTAWLSEYFKALVKQRKAAGSAFSSIELEDYEIEEIEEAGKEAINANKRLFKFFGISEDLDDEDAEELEDEQDSSGDNSFESDEDSADEEEEPSYVSGGGDYHNRYQDWREGSIVDAGIVKDCEVAKVVSTPVLHFYLWTPRGKRMTYFPFRGNRTEWTDSYY